jgi:REP element-mobilizing transposase RayT
MDNHYHLLLETPCGNLPQIMRHINGAYTTYFNVNRLRSGHLFQWRYKAILVDIDEYAKELSRYIHLNPVGDHSIYLQKGNSYQIKKIKDE